MASGFRLETDLRATDSVNVRVLGCSGGIGGSRHTTSFLIDDDLLVDCGTGVGELSLTALKKIRHIFITHAHLDHVCMLPLLVDSVFDNLSDNPITLYAPQAVLDILYEHLFNWQIWPDFFTLPSPENPVLLSRPFELGEQVILGKRNIASLPVDHTVAAQGYCVSNSDGKTLAFSGDTGQGAQFWEALNSLGRLDYLFVECAYPVKERELARAAKHYTPCLLAKDLERLTHNPEVSVCHLKPGQESLILDELKQRVRRDDIRALQPGQQFSL